MKILELGHVAFKCRDLKASEKFYSEILGFKRAFSLKYSDREDGGNIENDKE